MNKAEKVRKKQKNYTDSPTSFYFFFLIMSQRPHTMHKGDEEEEAAPLLISPESPSTSAPRPTASRSYTQRSSYYNTFNNDKSGRVTKPKQPMRTTKISQKLKLFPEDEALLPEEGEEDADVYTQLAKIPHGMERQEAEMLNKMDRSELSRMTAYCTAS